MDFLLRAKKEGVPNGKVNSAEMEGKYRKSHAMERRGLPGEIQ